METITYGKDANNCQNANSVKPHKVNEVLDFIRSGGVVYVATYARVTVIYKKCLKRFEKDNYWLIREDGDGYRLRQGKGSVYLFPGQLMAKSN